MSIDNDTVPAAEIERAEPLSTLGEDNHDAHKEVGAEAAPAAAAPAPASAPAAVDPATKPGNEQPFWYRKEIAKEKERSKALERELEQARRQPSQQQQRQTDGDDPNRPLTVGEVNAIRERDALVGRLERSEERFVDKLGEETFESTREWLATRPDIEEWALKQRDPWKAAHSQFTKEKLAAEIGEDPKAWQESERERIRQEIRAELAAETGHQAARRDPPQMRSAPPAPTSTVRSAAPRDDAGRFAGPQPIGVLSKHKFG